MVYAFTVSNLHDDREDERSPARALAKEMARKFDDSDFVGEHDYWWGLDQDAPQLYRYVIRSV